MRILLLCIVMFCVVGRAAEDRCVLVSEEKALLHRIEKAMDDRDSLWVAVVREGQVHTASYRVNGERNRWRWYSSKKGVFYMIMPVMDSLQNEALRGYTRNSPWREVGFSAELEKVGGSLNTRLYDRTPFFSKNFRVFLLYLCPKLHDKNKATRDDLGHYMTKDVLRCLDPGDEKILQFLLQTPESCVSEIVSAKKSDPIKVFIPIPNIGVVSGVFALKEEGVKEVRVSPQSYLAKKMNGVLPGMLATYPYDAGVWKNCLNYEEGLCVEAGLPL